MGEPNNVEAALAAIRKLDGMEAFHLWAMLLDNSETSEFARRLRWQDRVAFERQVELANIIDNRKRERERDVLIGRMHEQEGMELQDIAKKLDIEYDATRKAYQRFREFKPAFDSVRTSDGV